MTKRGAGFLVVIAIGGVVGAGSEKSRHDLTEFAEKIGLSRELNAGVRVGSDANGVLRIVDEGNFVMQYMVVGAEGAAEPNVIIGPDVHIKSTVDKAVIITHGWIDQGERDWPSGIAAAIRERTDPNEWVCGYFDWRGGAKVVSPVDAARYGRDIGGKRLGKALCRLGVGLRHVHLIGHSAGSWTIDSAGKYVSENAGLDTLHLTYLDAYVPSTWDSSELADIRGVGQLRVYAEHYYTKDITLKVTEEDLEHAFNADITAVDPWFKEHEFPYRWYHASITGSYERFDEKKSSVVTSGQGRQYGFGRSLEAGADNFESSLGLGKGNKAVKLKAKSKPFGLDLFKKR
jgi:hypothetical protein